MVVGIRSIGQPNNSLELTVHLPQKSGHNQLTKGGVHEEEKRDL